MSEETHFSSRDHDLDDDSWDVRETFAYFGRAFYMASVLEVGLAHALLFGEFMQSVQNQMAVDKGKHFDRAQFERDFDAYMNKQFSLTMGNIIRRVHSIHDFSDEVKERISLAKERRDFITHHYWRERSINFVTSEGRAQMREELNDDAEMFLTLDRAIDAAMKATREKLGLTDELSEVYFRKMSDKIKAGLQWDE